jgi:hypothetical protein
MDRRLDPPAAFSPGPALLGVTLPRGELLEGDRVAVGLLWQAPPTPAGNVTAVLQGVDSAGRPILEQTLPPVDQLPTSQWQTGDVFLGWHILRLPADVPGGRVQLRLGLRDASGRQLGQVAELGEMAVRERAVQRDIPAVTHPLAVNVGSALRLIGYDVDARQARAGGSLKLTLYWQAMASIDRNYKVFDHVVAADGRLVAQQDAEPLEGAVKMVVWKRGEVIVDPHVVPIPPGTPPGEYGLRVGMYDPDSGARLGVSTGGDFVALDRVTLGG